MLISYLNPLGEGKHVRDWLRDEIFDITAFPDKHPDGKFGLHYNRNTKLSAKQYFNQRIMHHDPRFRKDPEYIFVAEQLCTRQALERQISISARRGSLQKSDQGPSHYKLGANSDSFNIFFCARVNAVLLTSTHVTQYRNIRHIKDGTLQADTTNLIMNHWRYLFFAVHISEG